MWQTILAYEYQEAEIVGALLEAGYQSNKNYCFLISVFLEIINSVKTIITTTITTEHDALFSPQFYWDTIAM